MDYPKLRSVNIFPVQASGQTFLCLQDPLNLTEKALFLPAGLSSILPLFDGRHSILDIQAAYMRRFGDFLFTEKIEEIIRQLEENFFLEGDRFQGALREKEEAFKKSTVREAVFSGKSYEDVPGRLRLQLEGYFKGPDGPGAFVKREPEGGLKGVIAPHIDFQRGGFCYAFAHQEILERSPTHSFIILGTAHTYMETSFSITRKEFRTPVGTLQVNQELIDGIQSQCAEDLCKDEEVHRNEHSIEFQCVFLRYLYPEPIPLKIVPILCGSFHEAIEEGVSPMEMTPIRRFIEALRESVLSLGEGVCLIASADLSHIGHQFGDREGVREHDLRILAEEDREMLGYVERGDGEGFFQSISKEKDRRRICGLPAIYTLLKVLEGKEGRLLKYGQAFTYETQSVVSFASLAFY